MVVFRENLVFVLELWKCLDLVLNKLFLIVWIRDIGIKVDCFIIFISIEILARLLIIYKKSFIDYDFLKKKLELFCFWFLSCFNLLCFELNINRYG